MWLITGAVYFVSVFLQHRLVVSGIAARDTRDWRDGRGFEVRSSRFSERRTLNFELRIAPVSHVSRFARDGLWPLAGFFSIILLEFPCEPIDHYTRQFRHCIPGVL